MVQSPLPNQINYLLKNNKLEFEKQRHFISKLKTIPPQKIKAILSKKPYEQQLKRRLKKPF
jgi:hypothetical protein